MAHQPLMLARVSLPLYLSPTRKLSLSLSLRPCVRRRLVLQHSPVVELRRAHPPTHCSTNRRSRTVSALAALTVKSNDVALTPALRTYADSKVTDTPLPLPPLIPSVL